jgi:2-C-methyl-D-erythritol 4-phosphate cytidylyltransferase
MAIRSATAEIVAVHDGVRPFVTVEEITETVAAARRDGAAILATPVTDTIKLVEGDAVVKTVERRTLRHALTPQCFRYELLRRAYDQVDVDDPSLTDESALVERLGQRVTIVDGSPRNIKITTPRDLVIAETFLQD